VAFVVTALRDSGSWKWWSFVLLVTLALTLPGLMLGPIGLLAGILAAFLH
jgi:hypothetical protein